MPAAARRRVEIMAGLTFDDGSSSRLLMDYEPHHPQLRTLYENAQQSQWSAVNDVDWTQQVEFGRPLSDDSAFAMAGFENSPLAARGRGMWDVFRWEVQSWLVSQFLHGEQGALIVAGRLVELVPDLDTKLCLATQVVDEARHVDVFARYLREHVPEPYPLSGPLESLLGDILDDSRWDITALGMQIMVEALALASFRLADRTFHDGLIRQIARLVARDEARHVSVGVLSLEQLYRELTTAELADREELVLDAAESTRRRFLLTDIWERLDVVAAEGISYAEHDEVMVLYRRAIFSRVIVALGRVGLLTDRVREGLDKLGLSGFAQVRA